MQLINSDGPMDQELTFVDNDNKLDGDYYYVRIKQLNGAWALVVADLGRRRTATLTAFKPQAPAHGVSVLQSDQSTPKESAMRTRSLSALVALTSCVGVLAAAEIPRTADGHPDLSGTYDVATRTPLQRPKELGERATLSDAEAVAMAKKEAALVAQAQAGSDPDRDAPAVGGAPPTNDVDLPELTFAAGEVGGYNLFWIERGAGAFKIDGAWRTSVIIDPTNGRYPPLTPEAVKGAQARAKLRQKNTGKAWWLDAEFDQGPYDNPEQRPLAERCLLGFGSAGGPPLLPVLYNNLKRIVQTEDNVMIFAEMVHDARIVRMNAEHEPPYIRRWMGDSIGPLGRRHAGRGHDKFQRHSSAFGCVAQPACG